MAKQLTVIKKEVASIKRANDKLRPKIGFVSRDILEWVSEHWDSSVLNNMTDALNGNDRSAMILFFKEFTPFKYDDVNGFGAMSGSKSSKAEKRDKSAGKIRDFLADETNDFWTWCEKNVKVESKETDFAAIFKRAAKRAHDKGGIATAEMMKLMVESGIDVAELKAAVASLSIESDK